MCFEHSVKKDSTSTLLFPLGHRKTKTAKARMMRFWVLQKSRKDILSPVLCLVFITVIPPIREWRLAGSDWAEIHSLLTLLVGAERKPTARALLHENTAKLAELRWPTFWAHPVKQADRVIIIRIYRTQTNREAKHQIVSKPGGRQKEMLNRRRDKCGASTRQ